MRYRRLLLETCLCIFPLSAVSSSEDSSINISKSGAGAFEAAIAVIDERLFISWYDDRTGNDEIYLQHLGSELETTGSPWQISDSSEASYEPDIAVIGDKLALTWYEKDEQGRLRVMLALWDDKGNRLWQRQMSVWTRNGQRPVIEAHENRVFIAWLEESAEETRERFVIVGGWLGSSGVWLTTPAPLAQASGTTWNLNSAVLPDGRIALIYDAEYETAASELYLTIIRDTEIQVQRISADDAVASKYPDLAVNADTAAITWFDDEDNNNEVYLSVQSLSSILTHPERLSIEGKRQVIMPGPGDSIGAYLSWQQDVLGLIWNDDSNGAHQVYFQAFDQQGSAVTEVIALTQTNTDSRIPAIVPFRRGFALTWNEVEKTSSRVGNPVQPLSEVHVQQVPAILLEH